MADIDIVTNYSVKDLADQSMGMMYNGLELITLHFPSIGRANGGSDDKLGSLPVTFGLIPSIFFQLFFFQTRTPGLFNESECPLVLVNKVLKTFCSL